MSFAQLIFLLGGLAVVGPLVAHLMAKPKFRRLPFTMLRFLQTGQTESQSRRRLRDLLILALRCAIIVLIAMLFAQPQLIREVEPQEHRSVHYLGLDNSMSMEYSDGRSYFSKLVDSAVDYISTADEGSVFNICALASGEWTKGASKEVAPAIVQKLKVVPGSANIDKFLSVVGSAKNEEYRADKVSVLFVSDFTPNTLKKISDVTEPAAIGNVDYRLIVSPKPINNAAVTEAHIRGISDGKLVINATVINYGQTRQRRRLTAKIRAKKVASADIELSANQRRIYTLEVDIEAASAEEPFMPIELSLSAGDGLRADDTFYLAVSIPQHKGVNVLLADEGNGETFLLRTAMEALSRKDSTSPVNIKQILYSDLTLSDLEWADVVICSGLSGPLGHVAPDLRHLVKAGGKIIFFMTEEPSSETAESLWRQEVLPALPGRCVRELTYMEPRASDSQPDSMDRNAVKSLSNYRIDKVALTGYVECKPHPKSICAWRLQNGVGFVFFRRVGNGIAILVNTSADDSLGSLTKSNASVAFCRYLLGQTSQIGEFSFACDERVTLPASDFEVRTAGQKEFLVQTCDGQKHKAAVTDPFLVVSDPAGVGWVKTLNKPVRYAGINLPQGETDMTKPSAEEVTGAMDRAFQPKPKQDVILAKTFVDKEHKPIWNVFAWLIIGLLLIEPTVANRLKR